MTMVAPGDPWEAHSIIEASFGHQGPLFIRLGKNGDPHVHPFCPTFRIGKGIVLRRGRDAALVATGSMLDAAAKAADLLERQGLKVTLASMHTIKPLDEELVLEIASECRSLFTVEEHSLIGGLGSAVAEVLAEDGSACLFRRIALPDRYGGMIGGVDYLRGRHGLTPEGICKSVLEEVSRCRTMAGGR